MRLPFLIILIAVSFTSGCVHDRGHLISPQLTATANDPSKWTIVEQSEADFGKAGTAKVMLLKSTEPTDEGGAGQPLFDVDLQIVRDGQVLYDYVKEGRHAPSKEQDDTKFYVDDVRSDSTGLGSGNDLSIKDVTSDGIPEIIFHSGHEAFSDFVILEHVLKFNSAKNSFVDIAGPQFFQTGTRGLRWLTLGNRALAVISRRGEWSRSTVIEDHCHYCPSQFIYDAYEWNQGKQSFIRIQTFVSKQSHSDGSEALNEEWTYIQAALRKK